jgi:hypothetical protein
MKHIRIVRDVFDNTIIPELETRKRDHDISKLQPPEKETYDKYIPLLQEVKYGTPEYNEIKDKMAAEGTAHHYEVNRHHPEHFENGIRDMTLIDVIEMFVDWYSASKRSDTGFEEGLNNNKTRFDMPDELYQIMVNTYNEYFK